MLVSLLVLLMTISSSITQECLYQYVQQPPSSIPCNPHSSELQLHCIFTGPHSPLLQIQWYSFHLDTPGHLTSLSQSPEFYTIETIVMDTSIGMNLRSISSVLQTSAIGEEQISLCYFCKAQIGSIPLPVASNSLCIHDPSYYTGLPLCKDSSSTMVNTSSQCVPISESFRVQLQQLATLQPQASTNSPLPTTTSNVEMFTGSSGSNIGSVKPTIYINTASSPEDSLSTSSLVVKTTTTHTAVSPTPTVATIQTTTTVSATDDGNEMNGSPSTVEAGLYAAIVVCVVFVIVIGTLVVMIVCLSQRKCKCFEWRISGTRQHKNGQEDQGGVGVGNRVFNMSTSTEAQSLIDDVIDGPRLIRPPVSNPIMPTQQILNKRSLPRSTSGEKNATSTDTGPPNLPPKPGKPVPPSQKGQSTNYDHLELVDQSTRSMDQRNSSTSDVLMSETSEIPPKKPPRSRSRDHFYHTLENSGDESGLLRSAASSRMSSRLSRGEDEEGYSPQHRRNRSSVLSEQIKELFDDPRYAVLFVDEKEGLEDRRELCRSTPSLMLISKPGVPERRSLRTPHKRISILHDPLNDHSHC